MKIESANEAIPWARPAIDDAELQAVVACMNSGWLTSGPRVEQFEKQMAERAGRRFGIAVSNGTAALELALRVLGVGPQDEVIIPAFSYVATASAVALQHALPVFADIDRRNLGLDPELAAARIGRRTAAILCTDHGGNPCDYAKLTALADRQALAAEYRRLLSPLGLSTPAGLSGAHNSNFLYSVMVPQRDAIVARLKTRGIDTRVCYPMPLYRQPIFRHLRTPRCPVAEETCATILNPPMFYGLTALQQERVVQELSAAIDSLAPQTLRAAG
jgi:dTDP-4-amino-4,6-dideoxygalactose transaminase